MMTKLRAMACLAVLLTCGCGDKVCVYEQPAGKFCAVMDKCTKGEPKDFVEGDDSASSTAGKKTCESLGFECGPGYTKGRACSAP